jgi:hypothetical protein
MGQKIHNGAAQKLPTESQPSQGFDESAGKKIIETVLAAVLPGSIAQYLKENLFEPVAEAVKTLLPGAIEKGLSEVLPDAIDDRLLAVLPDALAKVETDRAAAAEAGIAAAREAEVAEREAQEQSAKNSLKASREAEKAQAKAAKRAAREAAEVARTEYLAARKGEIEGGTLGTAAFDGPAVLRASDGDTFVPWIDPIVPQPADLALARGRSLYTRPIAFDPGTPPALVTSIWLIAGDKAVRCDIPGGLRTGGGNAAAIPANHLVF